jgi:ubiquinone/menaquinone biosynthesis C-methylase UbiE
VPFHFGQRGKGRQTHEALATFTGKRMEENITHMSDRYTGLAETYNTYRPSPPAVIPDMLIRLARMPRPRLVVDLGCGTGLSTFIWVDRAEAVVGIEPNEDMRRVAEARTSNHANAAHVHIQEGIASQTGLPDACADVVTCSQSFHWMEPGSTLAEAARILRSGGVLAAYDHQKLPTMDWEAEEALITFWARVDAVRTQRGLRRDQRWPKAEHLHQMQASGRFRYLRDTWVHSIEMGNAERLVGYARSHGSIGTLLRQGLTEKDIGLDDLRVTAQRTLGDEPRPWFFSYSVRIGIK